MTRITTLDTPVVISTTLKPGHDYIVRIYGPSWTGLTAVLETRMDINDDTDWAGIETCELIDSNFDRALDAGGKQLRVTFSSTISGEVPDHRALVIARRAEDD